MANVLEHKDEPVDAGTLKEERYIWMARSFALVALLALLANIFMLVALSGLTPLVRVQPFYLTMKNKDQQIVSVERVFNHRSRDVQSSLIREYVMARYGVGSDISEAKRNWQPGGLIEAMSAPSVWEQFIEKEFKESIKRLNSERFKRDVRITNVQFMRNLGENQTLWLVDMTTTEAGQKTMDAFSAEWAILLIVDFDPSRSMQWEQRLMNPLGFRVLQFNRQPFEQRDSLMRMATDKSSAPSS